MPRSQVCDATERAWFDSEVTSTYQYVAGYGKPIFMVAGAYSDVSRPMPTSCQLRWYVDLANSMPSVIGVSWFLYQSTFDPRSGMKYGLTEATASVQRADVKTWGSETVNNNVWVVVDAPSNNSSASASSPLFIGGWAVDRSALNNSGIDTIHIYAYPTAGGPPVFLGVPSLNGHRPDVGAYLGPQFAYSGYGLVTDVLMGSPGTYDIVLYGHSSETGQFSYSRVGLVRVNIVP